MIPSLALIGTSELILIAAVVCVLGIIGIGTVVLVVWAATRSKSGTAAKLEAQRSDER